MISLPNLGGGLRIWAIRPHLPNLCLCSATPSRSIASEGLVFRMAEIGHGSVSKTPLAPQSASGVIDADPDQEIALIIAHAHGELPNARAFFRPAYEWGPRVMGPASMCPDHRLRRLVHRTNPEGRTNPPQLQNPLQ